MAVEISKSDILAALTFTGIEDEPRWGYSGRGMYGARCFGFTGTMEDYSNFLLGIVDTVYDQTEDIAAATQIASQFGERVSTDSMGYDTIFYFPGITVLENE